MVFFRLFAVALLASPSLCAQPGEVGIGTTTPTSKLQVVQGLTSVHASSFSMTNASAFASAVNAHSGGSSGSTIYSSASGGARPGLFQQTGNSSAANGLQADQFGLGRAGHFEVINANNNTDALLAQTNGLGAAVRAHTTGVGNAGEFQISNTGSTAGAVRAFNNGSGGAIEGYSLGAGRAAFFQIGTMTTSEPVVEAITYGIGVAGKFTINNPSSFNNAVEATTNGAGYAGAFYGAVYMRSNSAVSGSYALRTYNSSNALLTSVNNNGNLEVSGFTQHGSGAPVIKQMKLISTTSSSQGGSVSLAHGLDPAKILAVDIHVEYVTSNWVPANLTIFSGYEFSYIVGGANIIVYNKSGASAGILSKPVKVLITYEQ